MSQIVEAMIMSRTLRGITTTQCSHAVSKSNVAGLTNSVGSLAKTISKFG